MHHRGGNRQEGHFAHAARAIRPARVGEFQNQGANTRGNILDRGNEVGREAVGHNIAIFLDEVFDQRPAQRLHHAALDLAFHLLGVDRPANVVAQNDIEHPHLAGLGVHFQRHRRGHVAISKVRFGKASSLIKRRGGRGFVNEFHGNRPLARPPAPQRPLGRALDRVPGHESQAGSRRAARIFGERGVGDAHFHFFGGNAQGFGGNLQHGGVVPLAHFRARDGHHRVLDFVIAGQFHLRPTVLGEAERKANVLEARGKANAALDVRLRKTAPAGPGRVVSVCRAVPALRPLAPARGFGGFLDHLLNAHARRHRRAHRHQAAFPQHIAQAQFHRVHAQGFGEFVHLHFGHKITLGAAKTPERAARHVVGVNRVAVHPHIRDFVGAGAGDDGIAQHLVAGVPVSAAVSDQFHLCSNDLAFFGRAPFGTHEILVAFVVANDGFFAAPDDFDGAVDAALVQPPNG